MATTNTKLNEILGSVQQLVPWIEERAMRYVFNNYVMPSRVSVLTDMTGWNTRKVSEYLPPSRAGDGAELTDLALDALLRTRKNEISPYEVGVRHIISDRRISTDLEPIFNDTVTAIGNSIGDRVESDLFATALSSFYGGSYGSTALDFSVDMFIDGAFAFSKRGRGRLRDGRLQGVIHPFQAMKVMSDLVQFTTNTTTPDFVNSSVQTFQVPTFQLLDLVIGDLIPRNVESVVKIYGTGGTYRLQVGAGYVDGENITGAITASGTASTNATNIATALNALDMSGFYSGSGTWSTAVASDASSIIVTPPADLFLDRMQELRVAVKHDEDATLDSLGVGLQKSAYDLVTGVSGGTLDINGNEKGVEVFENGATAKALLFYREALAYDIRQPIQAYTDVLYQNRAIEVSANTKYGVGGWSPEFGAFLVSKADAPDALGLTT